MANTKGTSVISNPTGGGAQSGIGEKFSSDLFTGTGNFSVPIAVPPGRNGFQPSLSLEYSSGNGNGLFGMGWTLNMPGVRRKTSKGIPVYEDKSDIFILSGAEDLVPVKIEQTVTGGVTHEKTYYRPRTEGMFAKIIRHKKSNGEHYWEVRSKEGLVSWYGTEGSASNDPCVIADPENRASIFSWHLSKTEDPFGNVILYEYERELIIDPKKRSYDQLYLSNIKYAQYPSGGSIKYLSEVRFLYEVRPDPFSGYMQGFEVRTTRRCIKIETYTNAASLIKAKTQHFNYANVLPLNGVSLLKSVSAEGHNGSESEWMPPLEFNYSSFDPNKRKLQPIKGPLPVMFLSDPGYELVDITGNGLPDLLQMNGVSRYWTNKGNGEFGPPRNLNISPSARLGMQSMQVIDANGDGRSDLLVNDGITSGYFPGAFRKVWDDKSFRTYPKAPSFNLADPEVQLIDLDGDGITDVLRNGAQFECFLNHPEKGFHKVRTAKKKISDFSFSNPHIRFADMTGDGLQDIVYVSSGCVQYWPNMGYGRFGNKVNMKNAPVFPEQYDPYQILIGDLDGDGQADIVFIENNRTTLYVNQSGNSFSTPVRIGNTPVVRNTQSIRIADMMGTGQAGILWTFGGGSATPGKMYFLDFTDNNKPYVLEEMNNNMGSITRVKYGSSIYHYLRDEKNPKTRWKTDLPFPVQVVNKVEVLDLLNGGKIVTEYKYHNGYWDGVEREFRGFARVDMIDTETFVRYNIQDLFSDKSDLVNTIKKEHYSQPTETRTWFFVGAVGDNFNRWEEPDFSEEYWSGDLQIFSRMTETRNLLNSLPRRARRDALRTLRGSIIRTELYALDGSDLQDKPYTVTESLMGLRKEFDPLQLPQPLWAETSGYNSGGGYIFLPFSIADRTTQYERGSDPMHNFSFVKEYDSYGQVQGQLSVGVPRGANPLGGGAGQYLATYNLNEFIYKDIAGQYMVNRVKRSLLWDISQSAVGKSVFKLRDDLFNQYDVDPFDITFPVVGCAINFYDGAGFSGLPYGEIGIYGAHIRSETLVITDSIVNDIYAAVPECFSNSTPDWSTNYPTAFASQLQNGDDRLGYKAKTGLPYVDGWYAESVRVKYDFQSGGPVFGLIIQSRDMFDTWEEIEYDVYFTLPVRSIQYLTLFGVTPTRQLVTEAVYDYRVMQPTQINDHNENIIVFDFSPFGLLRASAMIGKGTEGDYKSSSGSFYDKYQPTEKLEYDFFAFRNTGNPVWVKTTSREKHYQDSAVSDTITKIEYTDGFGRLIQTRVQAEDVIFGDPIFGDSGLPSDQNATNQNAVGVERSGGSPLNVVISGWKVYNNKGQVVEEYEPFFDLGFDFLSPDAKGVKIKMYYDPVGRLIKTVNPNNTMQLICYGIPYSLNSVGLTAINMKPTPWESYIYDVNDLASVTHPLSNPVPGDHNYTPKSMLIDALGRNVKTTEHNAHFNGTGYENVIMQYVYDVRGNLIKVIDPLQRTIFTHSYDYRIPEKGGDGKPLPLSPLKTIHIDGGTSTVLLDAAGKPVESYDAKGALIVSAYDTVSRPIDMWAKDNSSENITLRQHIVYGDSAGLSTPENDNLRGNVYEVFDEAGYTIISEYDFKGNALRKETQVISDTEILNVLGGATVNCYRVDWTGLSTSILDSRVYETETVYDAMNRITEMKYPEDLDGSSLRKTLKPKYNKAGALEKVELTDGTNTDTYVEHIAYNAKGQRLMIALGNGIMTRYAYDPFTFRLLRLRSESYTKSSWVFSSSGNVKQDTAYEYDFAGNILHTYERTTGCGVANTNSLNRDFDYDPLYRLLSANGRENSPTITPFWDDSYRSTDTTTTTTYTQNYEYDKLGNITKLQHIGNTNFTRNFNYSSGNKLSSVAVGSNTYAFTYDACGNQLSETSSRKWEWDYADMARCFYTEASGSITQYTHYLYNSGGQRVKKLVWTAGGSWDSYVYIDGIYEFRTNDISEEQNLLHIMDERSRIAMIRIGDSFGDTTPAIKFNLEDNLGGSLVLLDNGGSDVNKEEYYPFGETSFGSYALKRYKYCGKERDNESGLYYYGARYYNAWICRFISVDPLATDYPFYTPYNYAGNKPIGKIDIDGLQEEGSEPKVINGSTNTETTDKDGNLVSKKSTETQLILKDGKYTLHHCETTIYYGKDGKEIGRDYNNYSAHGDMNHPDQRTSEIIGQYLSGGGGTQTKDSGNIVIAPPRNSENLPQKPAPPPETQLPPPAEDEDSDWGGVVPVYGSARDAYRAFENGNWGWGIFHTVMAISDLFLVKALYTAVAKTAVKVIAKAAAKKAAAKSAVITAGTKGGLTLFKAFTKRNFRYNLGKLTGHTPANSQAHHVFPQKFESIFSAKKINIHNPKFGAWWNASDHLSNAPAYNAAWESFLKTNPSRSQIMDYGRQLMKQYRIPVNF